MGYFAILSDASARANMKRDTTEDFPHLEFKRCWSIDTECAMNLGRCEAYVQTLGALPIPPESQEKLRVVSFNRGAQATTAIEGNTLTDEELQQMLDGTPLSKSRAYQGIEVKNALDAMNSIWTKLVKESDIRPITPRLLCEWNKAIGKDLGPLYDGVPGRIRKDRRHVGRYLAPPPEDVPDLLERFCEWLKVEFRFGAKDSTVSEAIQQAVSAHVFFEWIHPFADGNGRTGRLLEFYILLRAGLPDISVHVLANHYNATRSEYTAHFDVARKKRNLSEFIKYAVQGLTDGLEDTLREVQRQSCRIAWESHVYKTFATYSDYNKRSVFKRRRMLALAMPIESPFSMMDLLRSSSDLMQAYLNHDERMIRNDAEVLLSLKLIVPVNQDAKPAVYIANIKPMLSQHLSSRVGAGNR
jgi:Fic family protein